MKVDIFIEPGRRRAIHIGDAVRRGLKRHGIAHQSYGSDHAPGDGDVAIMYGLKGRLRDTFRHYVETGRHAVLIDLGYWNRKPASAPLDGHHRVSVDHWHPNEYATKYVHDSDRWEALGIELREINTDGGPIILAAMSAKAAWVYGLEVLEWERRAVSILTRHSGRQILYRPKLSAPETNVELPGTTLLDPRVPIQDYLSGAWALVTHHGNTGLDAIEAGVRVFTEDGIATRLAHSIRPDDVGFSHIEQPCEYNDRERLQFLYNAAYCQWTPEEIKRGEMWQYLMDMKIIGDD